MQMHAIWLSMVAMSINAAWAEDDVFQLGVVEVDAKSEQLAISDKEVLSQEDIARHNRNDVASALNLLPGISVQNLGARNERLIYLRGFNSRQVPLFMDGIPVYVPYDGNVDLNRFSTFDIGQPALAAAAAASTLAWSAPRAVTVVRSALRVSVRFSNVTAQVVSMASGVMGST